MNQIEVLLDRDDILLLIHGRGPGGYIECEVWNKAGYGILNGFPNEKWHWDNDKLSSLSNQQLYDMYLQLKRRA